MFYNLSYSLYKAEKLVPNVPTRITNHKVLNMMTRIRKGSSKSFPPPLPFFITYNVLITSFSLSLMRALVLGARIAFKYHFQIQSQDFGLESSGNSATYRAATSPQITNNVCILNQLYMPFKNSNMLEISAQEFCTRVKRLLASLKTEYTTDN